MPSRTHGRLFFFVLDGVGLMTHPFSFSSVARIIRLIEAGLSHLNFFSSLVRPQVTLLKALLFVLFFHGLSYLIALTARRDQKGGGSLPSFFFLLYNSGSKICSVS